MVRHVQRVRNRRVLPTSMIPGVVIRIKVGHLLALLSSIIIVRAQGWGTTFTSPRATCLNRGVRTFGEHRAELEDRQRSALPA
jgi:hypothetical protein